MNVLSEVHTVEETKHLVPNLESFSKAVFGDDSFFIECQPGHMDWATGKLKKCDGLVWLPWESQLWIIEVEWKESSNSNFFEQSRGFTRSKIDQKRFENRLKTSIQRIEHNLNTIFPDYVRGDVLISNIVKRTLEKHIEDGYLLPHAWVLLGHDGNNIDNLRKDYVREVSQRFTGKQHYIVTMARMFDNAFSTYFLLEHSCSNGRSIPNKMLVQGRIKAEGQSVLLSLTNQTQLVHPAVPPNNKPELSPEPPPEPPKGSRSEKIITLLSNSFPEININNLRFRFTLPDGTYDDFTIPWAFKGVEF